MFKKIPLIIITVVIVVTGATATYVMLDSHFSKKNYLEQRENERKAEEAKKQQETEKNNATAECHQELGLNANEKAPASTGNIEKDLAAAQARFEAQEKREKQLKPQLDQCVANKLDS